jgi:HPt (histidine-containing phosphotransfer) domain-containing protein
MDVASSLTEGLSLATLSQFKLLQQHFIAGLPARWQEIDHAAAPEFLQAALHRLAGSAGSYGFDKLSELARQAEALATNPPTAHVAQALMALKNELMLIESANTGGC